MQVDIDDIVVLLKLQTIDMEKLRFEKELKDLPQRKAVQDAREKQALLDKKLRSIAKLRMTIAAKCERLRAEANELAEKQKKIQADIDAAGSDFREAEALSEELGECATRIDETETALLAAEEEAEKALEVENQARSLMGEQAKIENEATASFVEEGTKLKHEIAAIVAKRSEAAADLSEEVLRLYEDVASRLGGVAVTRLRDGACGACRVKFEEGRLIELMGQGGLSKCPHCGRLLVTLS